MTTGIGNHCQHETNKNRSGLEEDRETSGLLSRSIRLFFVSSHTKGKGNQALYYKRVDSLEVVLVISEIQREFRGLRSRV